MGLSTGQLTIAAGLATAGVVGGGAAYAIEQAKPEKVEKFQHTWPDGKKEVRITRSSPGYVSKTEMTNFAQVAGLGVASVGIGAMMVGHAKSAATLHAVGRGVAFGGVFGMPLVLAGVGLLSMALKDK